MYNNVTDIDYKQYGRSIVTVWTKIGLYIEPQNEQLIMLLFKYQHKCLEGVHKYPLN